MPTATTRQRHARRLGGLRDQWRSWWPTYDLSRSAAMRSEAMRFDTTTQLVDDPLAAERALWEDLR